VGRIFLDKRDEVWGWADSWEPDEKKKDRVRNERESQFGIGTWGFLRSREEYQKGRDIGTGEKTRRKQDGYSPEKALHFAWVGLLKDRLSKPQNKILDYLFRENRRGPWKRRKVFENV